jgi:hypothetical protein
MACARSQLVADDRLGPAVTLSFFTVYISYVPKLHVYDLTIVAHSGAQLHSQRQQLPPTAAPATAETKNLCTHYDDHSVRAVAKQHDMRGLHLPPYVYVPWRCAMPMHAQHVSHHDLTHDHIRGNDLPSVD